MGLKYRVNEEFFDSWNSTMAYVLGYLFADGCLIDGSGFRAKYVSVSSVERYSIVRIRKWMRSEHPIITRDPFWRNGRMIYVLRIGSHKLFDRLMKLGMYPNKSLTVLFPEVPDEYLSDFIRGHLDGDGCVYLERGQGKYGKKIVKRLSTIFTSGSQSFLEKLHHILRNKLNLRETKVRKSKRAFQLRYGTFSSILLFTFLYSRARHGTYFKRKMKVFLRYFKLRPSRVDKEVQNVLLYLDNGAVVK